MTNEERAWQKSLRELGCIACIVQFDIWYSPCSVHHIIDGGRRKGEKFTIGLCGTHHQYGTKQSPSRHCDRGNHCGKALFEKTYGTEAYLLEYSKDLIARHGL